MKMLVIISGGGNPGLVADVLDRCEVEGYSEFTNVKGVGRSGPRLGTRAWPGESALFISVVTDELAARVRRALQATASTLPPGDRLHVAVLPVEDFS